MGLLGGRPRGRGLLGRGRLIRLLRGWVVGLRLLRDRGKGGMTLKIRRGSLIGIPWGILMRGAILGRRVLRMRGGRRGGFELDGLRFGRRISRGRRGSGLFILLLSVGCWLLPVSRRRFSPRLILPQSLLVLLLRDLPVRARARAHPRRRGMRRGRLRDGGGMRLCRRDMRCREGCL